jgi:hypothetical protein
MVKTWEELKKMGSEHYKTGAIEPIDLYKSMGVIVPFALTSIIKYASRNLAIGCVVSQKDLDKIIHYAEMCKTVTEEK